ncbi:hypothetical protein Tco_1192458 [Tanacetum coccineum]
MESTNIVSSCLDSKEREMQRMQVKARITKESCMNGFRALQSNFKIHSKVDLLGTPSESRFKRAFRDFFSEEDRTFKDAFFPNCYTVLSHADSTSLSPKSGGFYFICGHYY